MYITVYGHSSAINYLLLLFISINSHITPKHYNFHKISIDSRQYCSSVPYRKFKIVCIVKCIL